jgi:hypothetical protein
MLVVACDATLYLKACSSALYSDSRTLGATTQKLAMILMGITLERGSDVMTDAQMLAFQVMQGVVGNVSLISILHNVLRSWISWFSISKMWKKLTLL